MYPAVLDVQPTSATVPKIKRGIQRVYDLGIVQPSPGYGSLLIVCYDTSVEEKQSKSPDFGTCNRNHAAVLLSSDSAARSSVHTTPLEKLGVDLR